MGKRTSVCAILIVFAALAHAGDEQPMPPNAALKYWQAFALLPADADHTQARLFARPQRPETAEFVKNCGQSLLFLHQGAATRLSDWGVDYSRGLAAPTPPHLAKVRQLARVAVISAQYEFGRKDNKAGVDRCFDILALCRHVGGDGSLMGKLVECGFTTLAVDALASNLPACPPEVLDTIPQRLADLPPSTPLADVISMEHSAAGGWLQRTYRTETSKNAGAHADTPRMLAMLVKPEERAAAEAFWKGALADDAKLDEAFNEMQQLCRELVAIVALPGRQPEAALAQFEQKIKANPLARMLFPDVSKIWTTVARSDTRLLLLRAAADVVRSGPQAIEKHKDPFGEGPFVHVKRDTGFELRSALIDQNNQKVALIVCEPQQPNADQPFDPAVRPPPPPNKPGEF